jgi:hypothetical protein
MSPEDIPAEWVEQAAREVYAEWENEYMGDGEWPAWDSDENLARDTARTWARNILAAVLPEAMAEALAKYLDAYVEWQPRMGDSNAAFAVLREMAAEVNRLREGSKP